jgi:uncharacterized protein (DUF4415 family)
MKTKTVSFTPDTLPDLTEEQIVRLQALAALPDSEIDLSDIPEVTEEQWARAMRGRFYRPIKHQITARLDADVLDWLKSQGKGYQARMNAILRRAMLVALKSQQTENK